MRSESIPQGQGTCKSARTRRRKAVKRAAEASEESGVTSAPVEIPATPTTGTNLKPTANAPIVNSPQVLTITDADVANSRTMTKVPMPIKKIPAQFGTPQSTKVNVSKQGPLAGGAILKGTRKTSASSASSALSNDSRKKRKAKAKLQVNTEGWTIIPTVNKDESAQELPFYRHKCAVQSG
ncbi:hypothetical protein EK21DRAFT_111671 [Setomelanomma holmii]|uniref:Uncharacterized protein n=1 Tax=Setomelanomma holmii TaxID=210430 RepID=A0A9P4H954_9PLEO|nr:hypothetical protein EK21DRAFT_111671 [Setomelanomma holmii]